MSDDRMDPTGAQAPGATEVPEKKQGFFSTPGGRLVGIVGALALLAIIGGVVAAVVLGSLFSDAVDQAVVEVTEGNETEDGSQAATTTVEAGSPAAEVRNSEVFTFRDIFDPLLEPLPSTSTSTDTTTTTDPGDTDTVTPDTPNVLYLDGVVTEDGVMKAELRYNGSTYTLGPGEGIPDTPWEVLRVSSTSVTMLYGDIQVTLAVGQGITK
jgi:hypothetical protein